jgi:replicative DNA helicase
MQEFETSNVVIFIDYIQKMPVGQTLVNEKVRVEEISTALKGLSIELNCPVVAISSLSKEGCSIDLEDSDERPTMYHCKGSGDIEYDLDVACILAKDWHDTKELTDQLRHKAEAMGKDVHRIPKIDIVNLHIEKNRDAPEGVLSTIQYFFFIEENKFIELGYKLETDVYRFKKIENLVSTLVDRDYIKFYDVPEKGKSDAADDFSSGDDGFCSSPKSKIKLKY